jgi:hypothetical protein
VPLSSFIADLRKAVAEDPATAQALFAALGTLVVAEADGRTAAHSLEADGQPSLGGPLRYRARWPRRGRARPSPTGSG